MILDLNAWIGQVGALPMAGDAEAVRAMLKAAGVDRLCLSSLNAARYLNPHQSNAEVYAAAAHYADIVPVPVLDPTVANWPAELAALTARGDVSLVRLLPAYASYDLATATDLLAALAAAGLAVLVQVRLEDPRRQHPLMQVPDVPLAEVVAAAEQHPGLTVIVGGASGAGLWSIRERLLALPNLYADTSQADGFDGLLRLTAAGLTPKLLFGSHAPLFVPQATLARVLNDLDDEAAAAILSGNARRILPRLFETTH